MLIFLRRLLDIIVSRYLLGNIVVHDALLLASGTGPPPGDHIGMFGACPAKVFRETYPILGRDWLVSGETYGFRERPGAPPFLPAALPPALPPTGPSIGPLVLLPGRVALGDTIPAFLVARSPP